ncbi:YIPF1 protein, partial [Galbula dea]|nr:YIPF1 protein [Galbula dea]
MAAPDELRFQEFEAAAELLSATPDAVTLRVGEERLSQAPAAMGPEEEEPADDSDTTELLAGQRQPQSFWTFEYYQAFFNVDTQQVLERIKGSVLPLPGRNFVHHCLRHNPDLYGPFWICATLALALAVSGNLSYLTARPGASPSRYRPHFHHVTLAATLIFCYAWLVPLGLWGFLRWRQGAGSSPPGPRPQGPLSLLETLCTYGYSLSAFVPTAVLWLIPAAWLQWLLLAGAVLLSAAVLATTFWPAARPEGWATALALVATITSLHALLAVGC